MESDEETQQMWNELRHGKSCPEAEQESEEPVFYGAQIVGRMTLASFDEGFKAGSSEGFRAGFNKGWAAHAVKAKRDRQEARRQIVLAIATVLGIAGLAIITALEVL